MPHHASQHGTESFSQARTQASNPGDHAPGGMHSLREALAAFCAISDFPPMLGTPAYAA
jgi:hypothetical protein